MVAPYGLVALIADWSAELPRDELCMDELCIDDTLLFSDELCKFDWFNEPLEDCLFNIESEVDDDFLLDEAAMAGAAVVELADESFQIE